MIRREFFGIEQGPEKVAKGLGLAGGVLEVRDRSGDLGLGWTSPESAKEGFANHSVRLRGWGYHNKTNSHVERSEHLVL